MEYIIKASGNPVYYRANVSEKISGEKALTKTREGTHWVRLEQAKEGKIIFKQVRVCLSYSYKTTFSSLLSEIYCTILW